MGGGGQANKGQATGAYNSQQAASAQDMALSKQNQAYQQRLMGMLFGTGAKGSTSGSLTPMLDPAKLNDANLSGAYKSAYNQGTDQLAKDYTNARGSLAQSWANRGMGSGSTPSGFQADQERKMGSDVADSRGAAFSDALGKQHSEALNNFWNASNIASGNAASTGSGALQGSGQSGKSSAEIYGTAGQYHPSQFGSIIGSGLQAGGAVGAAAMCITVGMRILLPGGEWSKVEFLKIGDIVLGIDGVGDEVVENEQTAPQLVCDVATLAHTVRVSLTHAFDRADGGYICAGSAHGETLNTTEGRESVIAVDQLPEAQVCYFLRVKRSHGYNVEGFWSLE